MTLEPMSVFVGIVIGIAFEWTVRTLVYYWYKDL